MPGGGGATVRLLQRSLAAARRSDWGEMATCAGEAADFSWDRQGAVGRRCEVIFGFHHFRYSSNSVKKSFQYLRFICASVHPFYSGKDPFYPGGLAVPFLSFIPENPTS